jgi:hypothetical protein
MERFFILDKYNTWYDWKLILTAKNIPLAEPKTKLIQLDGMSGSLDLSETLTGEVTYKDRTITATFWTDYGTRKDREKLLQDITVALHGKKIKVVEPDDPDHYFYSRVKIKDVKNILPYMEFKIEAVSDPWRYAINEANRTVNASSEPISVVIRNTGIKTLVPEIEVKGSVKLEYEGATAELTHGTYKVSNIKLKTGVNTITVSGNGSVTFRYREATI